MTFFIPGHFMISLFLKKKKILHRLSYQLQMKTILFLPQKSTYIYFILLCSFTGRISSMMLRKNSERRHPCLVSDLRGKTYCFSSFSIMIAVGFTQIIFIELRNSLHFPIFENFYCEWVMDFVNFFSLLIITTIIFFLQLIDVIDYTD